MAELRDHKYQEQWEKQIRSDPEVLKDLLGAAFLINTEARRDGTRAVMSHPQLAEYLGVSVSTAQRHIRRLRELGSWNWWSVDTDAETAQSRPTSTS
jgi:hypothetical protein